MTTTNTAMPVALCALAIAAGVTLSGCASSGHAAQPIASTSATAAPSPAPTAQTETVIDTAGREAHWQWDTIRLAHAVAQQFPEIRTIAGWRPDGLDPDHAAGRAADFILPDPGSTAGKALGEAITGYVLTHSADFGVVSVCWSQTYRPAHGDPAPLPDRGSATGNFADHVHVVTEGHGYPDPTRRSVLVGTAPTKEGTR